MSFIPVAEDEIVKPDKKKAEIIAGTEKRKSIFSEGQNKAAGFAVRMENSNRIMNELEDSGFNPVNLKDVLVENFPLVPDAVERLFQDPRYLQYNNAKLDFGSAQLRQETGAQINESEFGMIENTYFPLFGEPREVLLQKRQLRKNALEAMKGVAGAAYDDVKKAVMDSGSGLDMDAALSELRERAKTDPDLRQTLMDKGLLDE